MAMSLNDAGIWLTVTGWNHEVARDGEGMKRRSLRVQTRTKADEDLVLGAEG
jgi:hypothetical protein